jgi:hypothetical protein
MSVALFEQLRKRLEQVSTLLLTPTNENLGLCHPLLLEVIRDLEQIRSTTPLSADTPLRPHVEEAARLSALISRLLHQAGKTQLDWAHMLLATGPSYAADGSQPALSADPRLVAEA